MKLIGSYIAKGVLVNTLSVLALVACLDLIFNLVDGLKDLSSSYGFLQLVVYLFLYLPEQLIFFLPVAILVGVLTSLGSLAASSELTVIRAAGVSIPKIILTAFKPILLILLIALIASEFLVPKTNILAKKYRWEKINQTTKTSLYKEQNIWLKKDNKIFNIGLAQENSKLYGLNIFSLNSNWEIDYLISAKNAEYINQKWLLNKVRRIEFYKSGLIENELNSLALELPLQPDNLYLLSLSTEEISLSKLLVFARYLQKTGQPSGYYWLAFWKAGLLPLTVFSVVLLGASFTFGPLRSVPAGTRVFHGIVIALGVKFTQDLLGPATILWGVNPIFAVLLPAAFCAGLGMLFIYKAR